MENLVRTLTGENKERSRSRDRIVTHGRGGAGNIAPQSPTYPPTQASDLSTPTLKSSLYTTGRGGSGNMAYNDPAHPEVARAAQDVEPAVIGDHERDFHYGRGGVANVAKPSDEEVRVAREQKKKLVKEEREREERLVRVLTEEEKERERAKEERRSRSRSKSRARAAAAAANRERRSSSAEKGWAEKGKEFLSWLPGVGAKKQEKQEK